MSDSSADLARAARTGDPDAFAGLVERHWNALVRLARSIVGDEDAEDAVQDALVAAWRNIHRLRQPGSAGAWLARMTVRQCLATLRRRPRKVPFEALGEPGQSADPGGGIDVFTILSTLAPRQRAVMHLTVIEGMSDSEIAAALGIRPGSVRAHRRRAKARLIELFGGSSHEPLT
ncbi:MAG: sigma-70 family RNA polymerase sigma factor [Acidobacteria bacterium]|nr:sigma-70 family RNA polymerase sigma factor [Acidobacteriota bacterium]